MTLVVAHDVPDTARAKLNIATVYRDASRMYRTRAPRVIGTAVIILVPITATQVVLADLGHRGEPHELWARILYLVAVAAVAGAGAFGAAFYAGVVDRTVRAAQRGGPERGVIEIFRELPFGRLIRAELLYVVLVVIGTAALVLPGLVAATLFSIVGPVMLVEDRPVWDTFRRSYRLARPSFWRMVIAVLAPLLIESSIADALLTSSSHPSLVLELLVEGAIAAFISSFIGLLEVHTAYQLIELDSGRARRAG